MAGSKRDAGRLYDKWLQAVALSNEILGAKYFDFKQATVFYSGHCLPKHKMARNARNFLGYATVASFDYTHGSKKG